jgi:CheY-like chemotaxis protein
MGSLKDSKDSKGAPPVTPGVKDTILVVEDSPPNRKILCHLLNRMGFHTASYENGAEAWSALTSSNSPLLKGEHKVVGIISDIMMPIMDGIELLRRVRGHQPITELPFVLVTAIAERDYISLARTLNVSGYILKPVTFDRVSSKLKELFPDRQFPKLVG